MRKRVWMTVLAMFLSTAAPVLAVSPEDRAAARAQRRSPVVEVFEATCDAVVSIWAEEVVTVYSRSPFDRMFEDMFDMPRRGGRGRQQTRESVGSGFVIHRDGYIVTNAHVVARTTRQKAIFADGRELEARIIATDTTRDVAILKIEPDAPLSILTLGRSDDLMVGETVIAIGNPLGYQHTVTAGVVSATDRDLPMSPQVTFSGLIQTDASINPGNSGGPLLNVLGELIGVNTAIRGDAQNIGFAIPVDSLRDILPDLLNVERRLHLVSGLALDNFDEPTVTEVIAGSPAQSAGVKRGDVLLSVDGQAIGKGLDFDIALIGHQPGDTLDLKLKRGGRIVAAQLTLGARPAPDGYELALERLGVTFRPLSEKSARQLGMKDDAGLVITEVDPDGPAAAAGLVQRDVLLSLGRHYVATIEELGQLLDAIKSNQAVEIRVLRLERRRPVQYFGPIQVR